MGFEHQFLPIEGATQTVLALHGTGGTERDLIPVAQKLFRGANILAPRGNVNERGASRFFKRFAEGVFDLDSMREETEKLAAFVEDAALQYGFDAHNVWALGYSNGANIAASLLLSRPQILKGAVLLRAMTPFEPPKLPDLSGRQIFLAAGQYDPIVPVNDVARLAQIFEQSGASVTLNIVGADHGLVGYELDEISAWLSSPK